MSRIDFVATLDEGLIVGADLFSAAVQCLTLSEAIELLPLTLTQKPERRRKAALRIAAFAQSGEEHTAIVELVDRLLAMAEDKRMRRKVLFPLRIIADVMPTHIVDVTISALLALGDQSSLDQAAFLMKSHWDDVYLEKLTELPLSRHTDRSLSLLISRGSKDCLARLAVQVAGEFDRTYFRRCVGRLTDKPELVVPLARAYGASEELYVRFKTGLFPSEVEARQLLHESFDENDFRLAIWCIGRFGYLSLLEEVYESKDEVEERITRTILGRGGPYTANIDS